MYLNDMKDDFTVKCPHCEKTFDTVAYINAESLICNHCNEVFDVEPRYSRITLVPTNRMGRDIFDSVGNRINEN